jgi:hypothetical protein
MTAVAILVALAVPVGALVALLRLVDALERRRADVVARQIALTDAIHAELGPVVAPLVRRGRGGRLEVVLAMPAGQPHLARIVQLAQATLGVAAKIVLVAREPVRPHRAPAGPLALTGVRAAR